jgi:hypothetical protein
MGLRLSSQSRTASWNSMLRMRTIPARSRRSSCSVDAKSTTRAMTSEEYSARFSDVVLRFFELLAAGSATEPMETSDGALRPLRNVQQAAFSKPHPTRLPPDATLYFSLMPAGQIGWCERGRNRRSTRSLCRRVRPTTLGRQHLQLCPGCPQTAHKVLRIGNETDARDLANPMLDRGDPSRPAFSNQGEEWDCLGSGGQAGAPLVDGVDEWVSTPSGAITGSVR